MLLIKLLINIKYKNVDNILFCCMFCKILNYFDWVWLIIIELDVLLW